jgi:hypothetical protein
MIKDEIRRIALLDNESRQKMLLEINAIADYNRANYSGLVNKYFDKS